MGIDPEKIKEEKKKAGKKNKKEKKDGTKERKKTPWKARQILRLERALKALTKLSGVLTAAKAPNVEATLASNALAAVSTLNAQVVMLPGDWKPERGHNPPTKTKLGIGSVIQVKADLNRDEIKMFKHISADIYAGASVVEDLKNEWLVMCVDGVKRVLKKKWAQKVPPAPVAAS